MAGAGALGAVGTVLTSLLFRGLSRPEPAPGLDGIDGRMPHTTSGSKRRTQLAALVLALLLAAPAARAALPELPPDFPLSPVTWGGLGGAGSQDACPELAHHPVILVHGDGDGPETWSEGDGGGVAGALAEAGFGPCEIWAVRLGQAGTPMRSLEELTDDLAFFIGSVMAYTGAPKVQLLAQGSGAAVAHTTLAKYRLHAQVHSAVYLDAPFQGIPGCDVDDCFAGEIRCCTLAPGSLMLRRALLPLEAPFARHWDPDQGRMGHLRYLSLGAGPSVALADRSPMQGGWMLDGAANLGFPQLATEPLHRVEPAWRVVVQALSDAAQACTPVFDHDGDGFCAADKGGADCDDGDPSVHPGADEVEADGIDQNCNGHDVDRRFPGWACERPMGDQEAPPLPPAPPPPTPQPEPPTDTAWLWAVVLLALLLLTGGVMLLRTRRDPRAGILLLALPGLGLAALQVRAGPPRVAPLPPLPAELRLGALFQSDGADIDAALARCQQRQPFAEPMPDRHPHAAPPGPHVRDLGFHAPSELDQPLASTLAMMEREHRACAKLETTGGPVLLIPFEGAPEALWSTAQQQTWLERQERLAGAATLLGATVPTNVEGRGLDAGERGAGPAPIDTREIAAGVYWVGSRKHGSYRPAQLTAARVDAQPVSEASFQAFIEAADYQPGARTAPPADGPAVWVDLADAQAYCAWVGGAVPSAELWEAVEAEAPGELTEWSTTAWDAHRVHQLGVPAPAATPWNGRTGRLGFRCAYASP